MKKIMTIVAVGLLTTTAMAQETYENAQLMTEDLNGTARYVGMGGALEALGADISTINTNPAGVAMFRKSWVGTSFGITTQKGDEGNAFGAKLGDSGKTNFDFNQIGFVYSTKIGNSVMNVALNYQKSRNFNQIMSAVNSLNDASHSKRAYMSLASLEADKRFPLYDRRFEGVSLQDKVVDKAINSALMYVDDSDPLCTWYEDGYSAADRFATRYDNSGYVSNFDVNISGNINDRVYLGMTFGFKDIHYNSSSLYDEVLVDLNNHDRGDYHFASERKITGSGFSAKFGAIIRPVEDNPFRFGLYINTPTWYDLNARVGMGASADFVLDGALVNGYSPFYTYDYKYKLTTPWKFGASVGTTLLDMIALGATYEFSDYGAMKNRIEEGEYVERGWDEWGAYEDYYTASSPDDAMNENTKAVLKGVSLLKIGMEVKPVPTVAIRLGYNYQSAIYEENGTKDFMIDPNLNYGSVGNYYNTYDYTNWKSTQRVTFGLGFKVGDHLNIDLAYQYAVQKGEYHPFQNIYDLDIKKNNDLHLPITGWKNPNSQIVGTDNLISSSTAVKNNRHQVNVTVGYRF